MPVYQPCLHRPAVQPVEKRVQAKQSDAVRPQSCTFLEGLACAAAIAGCGAVTGPALVACLAAVAPGCIKCVT